MSYLKKRTTPSPGTTGPPVQMYNPNQHSSQQNQWQPQQPPQNNWYNQPQQFEVKPEQPAQPYWQQNYAGPPQVDPYQPQPQQLYGQYQEQSAYYNSTDYQQQPYANMQYTQQYNQNNVYPPQQPPPHQAATKQEQVKAEGDAWSSWGWGDEDNSNIQSPPVNQTLDHNQPTATDESWNWSLDESKVVQEQASNLDLFSKVGKPEAKLNLQDHLTVSGKRGKLETPQWSVESQISQESSDDILHTSESDKSHMLSRSSTISHSPISGQDSLSINHNVEEIPVKQEADDANYQLTNQFENKEIVTQADCKLPQVKPNPTPPPASVSKFRSASSAPPPSLYQNNFNNQTVNLETLPDNSEHPDNIPHINFAKPFPQWPENNEAPINDRNQYLETGQLSDVSSQRDYDQIQDSNDTLPPPGLRRMVLGQMEQAESTTNNVSIDEPPVGLSRMVLGQTETVSSGAVQEPPEGLHRMIPGESSPPYIDVVEENLSEPEFQQLSSHTTQPRSATIGADTPPVQPAALSVNINRTEAIGGGDDGCASQDKNASTPEQIGEATGNSNRRHSIEGQTQDIASLTNSVRNLTVGENLTDGHTSNNSIPEAVTQGRRYSHSRQESSDSEKERNKKQTRSSRDKRSQEKVKHRDERRNKEKDRDYSPEHYNKDKKYESRRKYRDRRYEDDTDYYSEKERERRPRDDREFDKMYSSLRKDKEKDRRRPRDAPNREYGRDSRRGEYYYNRYDEEYDDDANRSRPSSRSDSMHDSYRDRAHDRDPRDRRHREKDPRYRRHRGEPRDMYNPYQGYAYDPYNPYFQQYQYYENLRRTNPQAYAEWYKKYYQQAAGQTSSYGGEDRASVHSGRSSANDELAKDSFVRPFDQTDASLNYNESSSVTAQRLTPAKFSTAHVKASIASGKLLKVLPNYPMDGQNATVEICNLQSMLANDEVYKELNAFPGPLVKGVTHKKTIIEYCENKIRGAPNNVELVDADSYVLMWELLILLIRQNGMVVGTDIAELLLKNREMVVRPPSVISSINSNSAAEIETNPQSGADNITNSCTSILKEEDITDKFREYLLYGSCKEALEWAMKHSLWGHALFLASKLDKRTYANVMMRFANGLTLSDPLQTLYQLLSGKMPAAVTCVSDEKWGDWKPHLAMILSNSTQRPELNCKAISALGDTLFARGSLYAAQFCYLMAQVAFGKHDTPESKLVLLGSDHNLPLAQFAINEAIHMTEIYEYACSLNDPEFFIPEFQVYKYLLATRLADRGLLEKSLLYLEKLAGYIVHNPTLVETKLVGNVCSLADRLKYNDPVDDAEDETEFGSILETSRPDNSWLKELRAVHSDIQEGLITQQNLVENAAEYQHDAANYEPVTDTTRLQDNVNSAGVDAWGQPQVFEQPLYQQQPIWKPDAQAAQPTDYQQQLLSPDSNIGYGEPQQYPGQELQQPRSWADQTNQYGQELEQQSYYGNSTQSQEPQQPQISMPNQKSRSPYDDEPLPHEVAKSSKQQSINPDKSASTGWFGGIFSKLALKPKNQMKLPEDKNPKIVWDQDKKRWINVDEDSNDPASEFKPPPKMADLVPKIPQSMPPANVPTFSPEVASHLRAPQSDVQQNNTATNFDDSSRSQAPNNSNMFKLQRGRNLKKSYVDVFNPSGKTQDGPKLLQNSADYNSNHAAPAATPQINFFVPPPVNNSNAPMDFLTPAPPMQFNEQAQRRRTNKS